MQFLKKDGIALFYEDTRSDFPPMLLVHGCGCDHTMLKPLAEAFSRSHRVISVDLRGHGRSDAPDQDYTMAAFADDLAWMCNQLGLVKPVAVGHSMGGNAGLELAARYPELLSSLVMIDSCMLAPGESLDALQQQVGGKLTEPGYLDAFRGLLSMLCQPTDRRSLEAVATVQIAQHVLASALPNHTTDYDGSSAAMGCRVPVAYIFSFNPFLDLPRFQSLTPQLVTARTLGSGHFSPIEVPDQVHAMITQFIRLH